MRAFNIDERRFNAAKIMQNIAARKARESAEQKAAKAPEPKPAEPQMTLSDVVGRLDGGGDPSLTDIVGRIDRFVEAGLPKRKVKK